MGRSAVPRYFFTIRGRDRGVPNQCNGVRRAADETTTRAGALAGTGLISCISLRAVERTLMWIKAKRLNNAATAPAAWLDSAFEPRLFEPKSPLPGNGILRAETKRAKRL